MQLKINIVRQLNMKSFAKISRGITVAAFTAIFSAGLVTPLNAQEVSEAHVAAAKKAISVTKATARLNAILPSAAANTAGRLIQERPDIEAQITEIVNESALELAPRRGDLEVEAAKIYARTFSEKELGDLAAFFETDTGQKFLKELPILVREIERASRVWTNGINRDLVQKVNEKMKAAGLQ